MVLSERAPVLLFPGPCRRYRDDKTSTFACFAGYERIFQQKYGNVRLACYDFPKPLIKKGGYRPQLATIRSSSELLQCRSAPTPAR